MVIFLIVIDSPKGTHTPFPYPCGALGTLKVTDVGGWTCATLTGSLISSLVWAGGVGVSAF